MKQIIIVPSSGKITLGNEHYLASGGEAAVYAKDGFAYKIYHDPAKMIPAEKIRELSQITADNVLKPIEVILDTKNKEIGYVMQFKKDTHAICRLFTKAFRARSNVTNDMIVGLVQKMQETVSQIHNDHFLIVDLNEMNILSSADFKIPFFIDVDSYQTPSYRATAIMESVRDRLIKKNQFTVYSDWFSFAIIAFTLYIGIHPYQGSHPKYKPNEWATRRMDDGISAFDPDVSLPRACYPFSVIPKPHLEWLKAVFMKNERSIPPTVDGTMPTSISPTYQVTRGASDFIVSSIAEYPEDIISAFCFMGVDYFVGTSRIYQHEKPLAINIAGYRIELCESSDMSPVVCKLSGNDLIFEKMDGEVINTVKADDMMYRNGCIYSCYQGDLVENSFINMGKKTIHKSRITSSISKITAKMFDGVVFQDLLGVCFATIPYAQGLNSTIRINELSGCRILEAQCEANICVVLSEKKGKYYRTVLTFDETFTKYAIRQTADVPYSAVNFAVLNNGVCILATENEVEIFKGNSIKVIASPPFDPSTKMYNHSGSLYFIDGHKICMAKTKK